MAFPSFIFQDWKSNSHNTKGKIIMVSFRIANYARHRKIIKLLFYPYIAFYKLTFEWVLGVEIPYKATVGKGLKVLHGHALVVNEKTRIGENCILRHSTTIGNDGRSDACPILGNNVNVGANVCIIGGVNVGNNATIGAGSVVVKDVPANVVVVGNPARIINHV